MTCEHCKDPDGIPCFPMYGLGPHEHTPKGTFFYEAPTVPGYTPNPDEFGCGWYWCPYCEEGKPKEPQK